MTNINHLINNKTATVLCGLSTVFLVLFFIGKTGSPGDTATTNAHGQITNVKDARRLEQRQRYSASAHSSPTGKTAAPAQDVKQRPQSPSLETALRELQIPPPTIDQVRKQRTHRSHPNPEVFSPERAERNAKIAAPIDAAANRDWKEFMEAAIELQSMSEYLFNNTLLSAIKYGAPPSVFKELLARGARFQPLHLGVLARSNNVPMIQGLMELGLDIHMKSHDGDNAINFVLETMSAREMFNFLLYHGVEVQNGSKMHDPLMFTLLKAEKRHQAVYFAWQLIQYGEQPGNEHLRQAEKLRITNPRAFQLIERNVPELISG